MKEIAIELAQLFADYIIEAKIDIEQVKTKSEFIGVLCTRCPKKENGSCHLMTLAKP